MPNAALIVAAGRGSRARAAAPASGDPQLPKQYARIGRDVVLARTLRAFIDHPSISMIQVVIHRDDGELYDDAVAGLAKSYPDRAVEQLLQPVLGGDSRQQSVWNGLQALKAQGQTGSSATLTAMPQFVLVHDAARPFVTLDLISGIIETLSHYDGAIAALPLSDTLKRADEAGLIADTVERQGLWRAQTPQGFQFDKLFAAHSAARDQGLTEFTDDAAIAEWAGLGVKLVDGSAANIKLTTAEDLAMAAKGDSAGPTDSDSHANPRIGPDLRIGNGFDVHRFTAGDHVWLCGIKIPYRQSLEGHSDADVGLHALTDALLGAIADGDIGAHFPPTKPEWKDASSDRFLADAAARVRALGGWINNVDVTLLCESPKIGPHRNDMRAAIAAILSIDIARVAVKATTTEGLGFTGRGEGIAAMATAGVLLPR